MKKLKYASYCIAMQEVPDEISLIINISGCPYRCKGCHSTYLWKNEGYDLSSNIESIFKEYSKLISCVCFMGGDQNMKELTSVLTWIKDNNTKTCLYTGQDNIEELSEILKLLDYIKIGHYSEKDGGLNSKHTNQRMYKNVNGKLEDITYKFWS